MCTAIKLKRIKMLWYGINLFIILIFVLLFVVIKKADKKWLKFNDYLGKVTHTVNSVRYGNLAAKLEKLDHPNYQNLSESINRMIETLSDREKMIIEYQTELTRQNKFLEAVINSLSDGILIVDDKHRILRATPQILNWFKVNESSILNSNIDDFIQVSSSKKIEKLKNDEIFIKNNSASSFEASAMKLILEDKKKRFVLLIKDTTNQKEVEKMREDFIATLTHDLKVPILAASNILNFLIEGKFGDVNDKQQVAISNMRSSNQELLELVQILLETYKIDENGIELEKEDISLTPFLKSIVDETSLIVEKSDYKINFDFENAENITLKADKVHLKRVVKNLIQNAISHSESTDIDIKVEKQNDHTTIKVIDYGKGIQKENIDKIFNKYYSTAKKFRKIGTGLGLYLSQQIIKAHGGEITVKSEENVGTEFCITF